MSDGPRADEAFGGEDSDRPPGDGVGKSGEGEHEDRLEQVDQPWDRPRRWNAERLDATRVDDLLARLRSDEDSTTGQRRRRRVAEKSAPAAATGVPAVDPAPSISASSTPAPAKTLTKEMFAEHRPGRHALNSPGPAPESAPMTVVGPRAPNSATVGGSVEPAGREPHRYLKRSASVVLALVSALVLGATGVYANIVSNAENGLKQNEISLDLGTPAVPAVTVQPTDAAGSSAAAVPPPVYAPENFLLVGSDTRAGANNIDGSEAELGAEANTDSLMVLHLSGDRQLITVISLPRDLWAQNVPCKRYDQAANAYLEDSKSNDLPRQHINSFYGVGGPQCLVDAVEKLTDLQITRYIQIDFSGFAAMVDALGGVTIDACKPIIDEQLSTVLPNAGVQVINGEQALNLARARKVIGDDGVSDPARIHRQQLILSAILRQVKSTDTLLNPAKLNAFVKAFTDNTSNNSIDFPTLLGLAESLGDLDPSKVTFYTLPTVTSEPADDRGSMDIDQSRANLLLNAIRTDTPVPGTDPAPTSTGAAQTTSAASAPAAAIETLTVAPDQINLVLANAADADGVASQAAAQLTQFGYSVPESALDRLDPDQTQTGSTIEYAAGNEAAALTVAASAPGAILKVVTDLGDEVRLVLGTSYTGDLVSATVGDPIRTDLLSQVPAGAAGNVITPSSDPEAPAGTEEASAAVAQIPQVNAATGSCL